MGPVTKLLCRQWAPGRQHDCRRLIGRGGKGGGSLPGLIGRKTQHLDAQGDRGRAQRLIQRRKRQSATLRQLKISRVIDRQQKPGRQLRGHIPGLYDRFIINADGQSAQKPAEALPPRQQDQGQVLILARSIIVRGRASDDDCTCSTVLKQWQDASEYGSPELRWVMG